MNVEYVKPIPVIQGQEQPAVQKRLEHVLEKKSYSKITNHSIHIHTEYCHLYHNEKQNCEKR